VRPMSWSNFLACVSVPTVLDCAVPLYRNTALASSRDVHVCRPPCGRLMTL